MAIQSKPKRQPYIKVKYKVDHPNAGIKKGDVVPIAYKFFMAVPPPLRAQLELVEGPNTMQELKENEMSSLKDLHTKLGEDLEMYKETDEEGKASNKKKK
jgi:hypothetical protein